jgi:magnesium transporter
MVAMAIIRNSVYLEGIETSPPASLDESASYLERNGALVWIGLVDPTPSELDTVAETFQIDARAIEDARSAHHRAKLKRYGSTLFTTLLAGRYLEDRDEVEFSELHVFTGTRFVVTVRYASFPDLQRVRRVLERAPEELRLGPEAVLYAILRQVMDEFAPIVTALERDIDEIEDRIFEGDATISRRIFDISREVIAFQRATHPLETILKGLLAGFEKFSIDPELRFEIEEMQGQAARLIEQVDGLRFVLHSAMDVHAILVDQKQNERMQGLAEEGYSQNEDVKRISAWAAILFAPSLIAGIYGMNFKDIPFLDNSYGFWISAGMMLASSWIVWLLFKRKRWI